MVCGYCSCLYVSAYIVYSHSSLDGTSLLHFRLNSSCFTLGSKLALFVTFFYTYHASMQPLWKNTVLDAQWVIVKEKDKDLPFTVLAIFSAVISYRHHIWQNVRSPGYLKKMILYGNYQGAILLTFSIIMELTNLPKNNCLAVHTSCFFLLIDLRYCPCAWTRRSVKWICLHRLCSTLRLPTPSKMFLY